MTYVARNRLIERLGYDSYRQYLGSDLWKDIRHRVLAEAAQQCCCCGSHANQVHHHEYTWENLVGEALDGLVAICQKCHKRGEFKGDKKRSHRSARTSIAAMARNFENPQAARPKKRKNKPTKQRKNHHKNAKPRVMTAYRELASPQVLEHAVELGLVVCTSWFGKSRPSLHVVIRDGIDDQALAEWWPSSKKGVIRTCTPQWTTFDDPHELLEVASQCRHA